MSCTLPSSPREVYKGLQLSGFLPHTNLTLSVPLFPGEGLSAARKEGRGPKSHGTQLTMGSGIIRILLKWLGGDSINYRMLQTEDVGRATGAQFAMVADASGKEALLKACWSKPMSPTSLPRLRCGTADCKAQHSDSDGRAFCSRPTRSKTLH